MLKKLFVLAVALLMATCLAAAGQPILEININGNINIDQQMIRSVVTFDVGEELSPDKVSESIKNLYQLGVFSNITVSQKTLSAGVGVDIDVSEYPIVDQFTYTGNDALSDSKLDETVTLRKGSYWSPFAADETIDKLKTAYKEKGYHAAEITFKEEPLPLNRVAVKMVIEEGKKVRVRKITFHGNAQVPSSKLKRQLETREVSLFRSGKFDKKEYEQDLKTLVDFYNEKGYIDARVINNEVVQTNPTSLAITIWLEEGQQFKFGNVLVEGNKRYTDEKISSQFKFEQDELFDMAKYKEQMNTVSNLYYEEGYIYAQFDQELVKRGDHVDIVLKIQENTRAMVRKINITGNRKTKEKIIRRKLSIHPGDYFQQSKIMTSQQRIYNLGFFEPDMRLDTPKIINNNGDVDLTIKLNDKTSGTANGGVGYNSQDHLVGQLSVTHNNLFGNAWSTGLSWEFGGNHMNLEWSFNNPYLYDTSTSLGFNVYHTTKSWDSYNYDISTNGSGIKFGRPIDWLEYANVYLGYSLYAKKYEIQDYGDYFSDALAELDTLGWRYNSSLTLTLSRDSRDNVFFPTRGSQLLIYNELAGGPMQGDFDYYKLIAQANWYVPMWWKLALRLKWRTGFVERYGRSDEVPPDERFYLGGTGADGIRGYADRSIGPDDGGLRMMLTSSEIAFPIAGEQITGLLFFDAGDSYNDFREFNPWTFKKGGGIGVRVQSPFGIIGFDYARNFSDNSWEPHFQFGTSF